MYITLDAILWFSLLKFNYITKGFSNVCPERFLKVLTVFQFLKNCFQKFFRTHINQTLTRFFKNNLRNNS